MNKTRIESFSDCVFAFAITLLVLGFQVPDLKTLDEQALTNALLAQLTQLVPYVTSFATIGIIWINHHTMFHDVEHVERGTLVLNLFMLLVVSFIPYPTAVLGRYGPSRTTTVFYGIVLTLLGVSFTLLSRHIAHRKLSKSDADVKQRNYKARRNLVGTVGYPVATAIGFRSPQAAVIIYFLLAAFYLFPERRVRTDSGGAR